MNMKNIVSLNFSDRIGRLDYFKGGIASVLIALSGGLVMSAGGGMSETNPVVGLIVLLVGFLPLGYAIILQFALVTRRFRDIGFNDNTALVAIVIGYVIVNAFFPPISLVPLFWAPKSDEAVTA